MRVQVRSARPGTDFQSGTRNVLSSPRPHPRLQDPPFEQVCGSKTGRRACRPLLTGPVLPPPTETRRASRRSRLRRENAQRGIPLSILRKVRRRHRKTTTAASGADPHRNPCRIGIANRFSGIRLARSPSDGAGRLRKAPFPDPFSKSDTNSRSSATYYLLAFIFI